MKKRSNNIVTFALALSFAFSTSSCSDFLSVEPTGNLTEEQVFEKIDNVEPLVLGLYKSYRGCRAGRNGLMQNLGNDETQQGNFQLNTEGDQAGMDKYNGQLNPSSKQVQAIWDSRWALITPAAKAIKALGMTKEDPERAKQLMGEACFIRGLVMYEMSMYWGEIPVIDMNRTEELGLGRKPLALVWEYIIQDFMTAAESLPVSYTSDPQRATRGAAYTMLAKAYMSAPEETGFRDFAKADEALKKVMDGKYSLVSSYADLWRYDNPNTVESIFELQFSPRTNDRNMWEFDCGSRACDTWFSQGCYFSGYDFLVPTPFAYKTVEEGGIWEDGDLRKEEALRYDFTYKTNKYKPDGTDNDDPTVYYTITPNLSKTSWTGTTDELEPHIKKFEDFRTDIWSGLGINNMWESGKTFPMLRFADVILMHAECLNELGQTAEAVNEVNNKIRTRAFGGELPADKKWNTGMSKEEFREKIMDERFRELCFEGWRRMDLIRTGKFVELVKARNRWAKESGTIQAFNVRYPIPETEIKTNEAFSPEDQNPGYSTTIK
ncbi:RagB/SusD family nutrient uptake outer membrane protein [Phocaeicola sp.]